LLCERYDLESVRVEARVTDIVDRRNGIEIQTTDGPVRSRWCLLAVGHGRSVPHPEWAQRLISTGPVTHVWEPTFDSDSIGETSSVGIVGGSITAAQLATRIAQLPRRDVILFARSLFRGGTPEASTDWMHFSDATEKFHAHPPVSRTREERVAEARYDGTMPRYVF